MKVIMINGSPHAKGCTYTALQEVAKVLHSHGIETELVQIGAKPINGCIACGKCAIENPVQKIADEIDKIARTVSASSQV